MDPENFQIEKTEEKQETKYIKNYKILKRIGFGSSGLVYKVTKKDDISNKIYILKQIPYSEPNLEETTKKANSARNEALILSKLNCKYIVKYYDSFIDSEFNLNIIMEYCDNGDLNTYIQNRKKIKKYLSENEIWNFFIQISLGLAYIHSKKILHRDLKPMNIFLTKKNEIKIGDLGVAKFLSTNSNAMTCIGTPYYLSPEICKEKPYNSKGDVWALGCILYELCTFEKPFSATNPAALILKIINGNYTPLNEIKNGMKYSNELQKMIEITLQKDYLIRPLMIDIINLTIFVEKAYFYGYKDDLINIKNLYENNDDIKNKNINYINKNDIYELKGKNDNDLNIIKTQNNNRNDNNINFYKKKPKENSLINKKNSKLDNYNTKNKISNNINNKYDENKKEGSYINSIKSKENYIASGKSSDSNNNNSNNIQTNNIKTTNNKYNIKVKAIVKPKKKYIKHITKNQDKYSNSPKNSINKNSDKKLNNNKNNQDSNLNKKLKVIKISPLHYRDCSGGKKKNIYIYDKNILSLDPLSNRNRKINSGEKKYICKTKNDIYNKGKKFGNKNIGILNPFQENKALVNNIKVTNTNINNNINNVIVNNNKYINFLTNVDGKNLDNKNALNNNLNNFQNINITNNINNFNINYSLNLIEKTRSNFYSSKYEKFINMKPKVDSIKMRTQNGFNNLHQFRIENGFEDTENYKNLKCYEINDKNKYSNEPENSSDDSECNVEGDDNDEENIVDDSDLENDENEEEKVSMVKEDNIYAKEQMNKKNEIIQKYNEFKNKIVKYKNEIDINKFFSMYEKMSKNLIKIEELENFLKNNLSGDKYDKFRKILKQFIYYDVEMQNLNNL